MTAGDHFLIGKTLVLEDGRHFLIRQQIGDEHTTLGLSFKAALRLPGGAFSDAHPAAEGPLSYFVKLPDPRASRSHATAQTMELIRQRFIKEQEKGDLINLVADRCRDLSQHSSTAVFRVPRFVAYSLIASIVQNDQELSEGDAEQYLALPLLVYDFVGLGDLDLQKATSVDRWFEFARALTSVVQRIHNQGILHSFIVPRHLLRGDRHTYFLVGFGYAALCVHPPEQAHGLRIDQPYRAPELNERESLDALWLPADLFSVGAILFKTATGSDPALYEEADPTDGRLLQFLPKYRDVSKLKDYVFGAVKDASDRPNGLFDQNENIVKIIDKCLRFNPNDRFSCAEELLHAIDIAQTSDTTYSVPARNSDQTHGTARIPSVPSSHGYSTSVASGAGYFTSFETHLLSQIENLRENISRHHLEIYGDRDYIVTSLCQILGGLGPGAAYQTITLPSYWTDNNLGSNGRFLTMNKHIARHGVRVQRVFLVPGPYYSLTEEEQQILTKQRDAVNLVREYAAAAAAEGSHLAREGTLEVHVQRVNPEDILSFERAGNAVAFVSRTDSVSADGGPGNHVEIRTAEHLSLNFISQGRRRIRFGKEVIERQIKKVRLWDPGANSAYAERFRKSFKVFTQMFRDSSSVHNYLLGSETDLLSEVLKLGEKPTPHVVAP